MSLGRGPIGRTAIASSEVAAAEVAAQEGWRSRFGEPVNLNWRAKRRAMAAALAAVVVWPAQTPPTPAAADQFGIHSSSQRYNPAKRSTALLGQIAWVGQEIAAAPVTTPTTKWWSEWQGPPANL